MSTRDWIWLGVVLFLLVLNYRLLEKLRVCRDRLSQHFLTWQLAAFGVMNDVDWEAKNELDKAYGVDCYKQVYRDIVKSAAENPLDRLDLKHAKARIESEWRRW
jgi:hypothetical protein